MKIICILAGGSGNRFGSPVPKQYHLIDGRPVIEYVIDASIKSSADEVLVVSDVEKKEYLENKYGVTAIIGGRSRNDSIQHALDYINDNYKCRDIILVDAVCPMVREDLFDLYFSWLEEYDAVFTAEEITTNLAGKNRERVDRSDYILIASPDAYRFDLLNSCFDSSSRFTTPLHMLPQDSHIKYYFDFKEYIKIIFPHDLAVTETLMRERERHIKFESHANDIVLNYFSKLRKINRKETRLWEKQLDKDIEQLFSKWDIYEFTVNNDAYSALVLECKSRKYGNVVLKMYPTFLSRRFVKESFIISTLQSYPQATLISIDETRNAMLLDRVMPGDYLIFEEDKEQIITMFKQMWDNRIAANEVKYIPPEIKGVVELTEEELSTASKYDYHPQKIKYFVECAKAVYGSFFEKEEKYILHGDAYYKNALRSDKAIKVIDPVGYVDAFIFEYMPLLTYELVMHTDPDKYLEKYKNLSMFFSSFTDISKFNAATFVFCVKQLVPSIYEANDNYNRASKYLHLIEALFIDVEGRVNLDKSIYINE